MKHILFLIPLFLLSCKTIYYYTGDQSFMKFDKENYEYYQTDSLSGNNDLIVIDKDSIKIFITGQEPLLIKIEKKSRSKSYNDNEYVSLIMYDGLIDGEFCRLIIIKNKKYIGYYHTYDEEVEYFTELVIFKIK